MKNTRKAIPAESPQRPAKQPATEFRVGLKPRPRITPAGLRVEILPDRPILNIKHTL